MRCIQLQTFRWREAFIAHRNIRVVHRIFPLFIQQQAGAAGVATKCPRMIAGVLGTNKNPGSAHLQLSVYRMPNNLTQGSKMQGDPQSEGQAVTEGGDNVRDFAQTQVTRHHFP
jgi:hypothetical protein